MKTNNEAVETPPEKKSVKRFKPFFAGMEASPHIVWSVLFIVAPLIFVCYYAFTDSSGGFTFGNIQALGRYNTSRSRPHCRPQKRRPLRP